jgi:hypothetical protein
MGPWDGFIPSRSQRHSRPRQLALARAPKSRERGNLRGSLATMARRVAPQHRRYAIIDHQRTVLHQPRAGRPRPYVRRARLLITYRTYQPPLVLSRRARVSDAPALGTSTRVNYYPMTSSSSRRFQRVGRVVECAYKAEPGSTTGSVSFVILFFPSRWC